MKITSIFLLFFVVTSCEIINEENLENDSVQLIAPGDNNIIDAGEINFFWEDLEGASSYRIQIAKPDFINPTQVTHDLIIQDSIGTSTSFIMEAGTYEWRVKAQNGAYESPYSTSSFTVN